MAEKSARLAEAVVEYVAGLPAESKQTQQQGLSRFVRWFGGEREVSDIVGQTVETYQQQVESTGGDVAQRMEALKSFLTYAQRKGMIDGNIAKLIKSKKASGKKDGKGEGRRLDEEVVHLTRDGYEQLKGELDHLVDVVRSEVAHELAEARIDKDFRENAPYDAAKQHQAHVEARIRELERIVGKAQIIEGATSAEKVSMGATVVILDLTYNEELKYTLVSTNEADPRAGKISVSSPVGRALLDRLPGETVEVAAPAGVMHYRIEKIEG